MNNFDSNSSGINIEFSAFYDCGLSRMYFEEAFFSVDNDKLVYCEDNFSDFELEYTFTKKELIQAWMDAFYPAMTTSLFLANDFKTSMGFAISKATKQELIDYMRGVAYYKQDWLEFCEKAGFKSNFDIVISRGYSQGDYKEVIVPHKLWECLGVKRPKNVQDSLGSHIDHLLWDAPIYCRLTVNGEEYYIDQYLKDLYLWDKSEVIEIVKNQLTSDNLPESSVIYICDWLASNVKTDIDYQN